MRVETRNAEILAKWKSGATPGVLRREYGLSYQRTRTIVGNALMQEYRVDHLQVIVIRGSDGRIGRCDARCWDAKQPRCTCVCGGLNHGKGSTHVGAIVAKA